MEPPSSAAAGARPGMRRKSSASNLLSLTSFKAAPMPPPVGTSSAVMSQTASTGIARAEWDAQSMYSETSTAPLVGQQQQQQQQPSASVDFIRDTLGKRMTALSHIRHGHEGKSHWLNTILLSSYELQKTLNNSTMKKRTYKFAVLGMSLSNLFDIHPSMDFLRTLASLLAEYDQLQDDIKPKMRNLFRASRVPKRGGGGGDYAALYTDAGESSFLVLPSMPFPLDYYQVVFSLCDILTEVYHKLRSIVGPSLLPSAHQPGISYMLSGGYDQSGGGSNVTSPTLNGDSQSVSMALSGHPVSLNSPPLTWNPLMGDMIMKIDGRLKKLIGKLLSELDQIARTAIREELSSLDPLLRNLTLMPGNPDAISGLSFDFDI